MRLFERRSQSLSLACVVSAKPASEKVALIVAVVLLVEAIILNSLYNQGHWITIGESINFDDCHFMTFTA